MKTEIIQSTSFGTSPFIGDISANVGLRKYNKRLTMGLLDAFDKLAQNGTDDLIRVDVGHKKGARSFRTDAIEVIHFIKDKYGEFRPKSSLAFSPKTKQKLSVNEISKLIQNIYAKIKESKELSRVGVDNYPFRLEKNISQTHIQKIKDLTKKYGFDDWTQE